MHFGKISSVAISFLKNPNYPRLLDLTIIRADMKCGLTFISCYGIESIPKFSFKYMASRKGITSDL